MRALRQLLLMSDTTLHGPLTAIVLCFSTGVTVLALTPGKSDSERLRELEGIVQQLRELANSSVMTRQPLARYIQRLNEDWQLNFGIEQLDSKVDVRNSGSSPKDRAPDFGANVRWEKAGLGHLQLSGVARMLGISGGRSGSQEVLGGGVNLAGSVSVFGRDNVIGQITYGQGIGRWTRQQFTTAPVVANNHILQGTKGPRLRWP